MGTWNTVTALSMAASGLRLAHWAVALTQSAIELAALDTTRTGCAIGPSVTNPVTESPHETARLLISLDYYLPERIWCGIGSGDSAVRNAGLAPLGAVETVEAAVALKRLLTEGRASWQGDELSLAPANHEIPVVVSAHGPRMLAAVGEMLRASGPKVDGLISGVGLSTDSMEFIESTLEVGLTELDICWNPAAFEVLSAPGRGEEDVLFTVAQACHHFARALRSRDTPPGFFPAEFAPGVLALDAEYVIAAHGTLHTNAERRRALAERVLAQGSDFVSYMHDRCLIVGTHDQVIDRLDELYRRGVRAVSVAAFGEPDRVERAAHAVARFNSERLPLLEQDHGGGS